ncbi:PspA-associated protein PspAB [Streptomyces shenzhenensis]|uniref:PspA-associated protein PspAB n=1 Tax=Streptomyces shenzhenensis TaxID=943815 RepID=UPI003D93FF74
MGLLDILLGRTKPVAPDLDQLFALPSAAVTLEVAAGFTPTGGGAVCFASVEGAAFEQTQREVRALLDADAERGGSALGERGGAPGGALPVELRQDDYGYSWLVSQRTPDQLPDLVNDLHAVNSSMEANGFGPQLLCSLAGFENKDAAGGARRLALVYLYKRGTFYPFAPLPGTTHRRDNALELQVKAALANDLRIEQDLSRWFPVWGAPGL